MVENKNNASKEGKKTLTIGASKRVLDKIKEGLAQPVHVVKGVEILSNKKLNFKSTLKSNLESIPTLGKSKLNEGIDKVNSLPPEKAEEGEVDTLTENEKQSRLKALELARQNASISSSTPNDPYIGFSVVGSSLEKSDISVIKKDKKLSSTKPMEKEEIVEDKTLKKKASVKKKDKNESERAWKDAYYEEDLDGDLSQDSIEEDNIDEEVVEYTTKDVEVVSSTPFVSTALKRVGKTRKDRIGNKQKAKKEIIITGHESIKTLAHMLGERLKDFVKTLENLDIPLQEGEDTVLDIDLAEMAILELGHSSKRQSLEDEIMSLYKYPDKEKDLEVRPPVVTIMGHVDHGKTTLLDYIRKTNVVSKESGGITQHIGAYQIISEDKKLITFLDTPGHEAFAEMRARGALVTDIIVLVVAADDGLKQQSIEVINHAQSANVPIIVAINKIDKPSANSSKVKTELLQHNVVVEDMGGKILCAEISALKGMGVSALLENILLEAELLDLKANINRTAVATVIEAKVEKGKGIVATVIVSNGTLKHGDLFVVGNSIGKVRFLTDDTGKQIKTAGPSKPVEIVGFNQEVIAGDELIVVKSEADAKKIIEYKQNLAKKQETEDNDIGLLLSTQGEVSHLPVIIKTDVFGSKEAILGSLEKIGNDEVKIKVVHAGVGAINESDILLAKTAKAVICGFNVRANNQAKLLADKEKVSLSYFSIIYDLLDSLKEMLSGLLQPKIIENIIGYAEIKEVFNISKVGKIAGCVVTEGIIKKTAGVRLLRNNVVIYEGTLLHLKRFKDDAKEAHAGQECGVMLHNFQDIVVGDSIECFEKITEKRELK